MSDSAKEFAVHLNWWYRASFTGGPVPTLEDVITARDTRIAAERDNALRELAGKWMREDCNDHDWQGQPVSDGVRFCADEILALIDSREKTKQEFCQYCGAGIGKFRRDGEGTCPQCVNQ